MFNLFVVMMTLTVVAVVMAAFVLISLALSLSFSLPLPSLSLFLSKQFTYQISTVNKYIGAERTWFEFTVFCDYNVAATV